MSQLACACAPACSFCRWPGVRPSRWPAQPAPGARVAASSTQARPWAAAAFVEVSRARKRGCRQALECPFCPTAAGSAAVSSWAALRAHTRKRGCLRVPVCSSCPFGRVLLAGVYARTHYARGGAYGVRVVRVGPASRAALPAWIYARTHYAHAGAIGASWVSWAGATRARIMRRRLCAVGEVGEVSGASFLGFIFGPLAAWNCPFWPHFGPFSALEGLHFSRKLWPFPGRPGRPSGVVSSTRNKRPGRGRQGGR